MSIVVGNELLELLDRGVITDTDQSRVKGSSIDVRLAPNIMRERMGGTMGKVRLGTKERTQFDIVTMDEKGFTMMPHTFLLGSTIEHLKIPLNMTAELRLKSTMARNGLNRALAIWIHPGFQGNITLELMNATAFTRLIIWPGLEIGQLVFHKHASVDEAQSYGRNGRYQGQLGVTAAR